MKNHLTPEIDYVLMDNSDVITTSDIEAGVETTPTESGGGSWEVP